MTEGHTRRCGACAGEMVPSFVPRPAHLLRRRRRDRTLTDAMSLVWRCASCGAVERAPAQAAPVQPRASGDRSAAFMRADFPAGMGSSGAADGAIVGGNTDVVANAWQHEIEAKLAELHVMLERLSGEVAAIRVRLDAAAPRDAAASKRTTPREALPSLRRTQQPD